MFRRRRNGQFFEVDAIIAIVLLVVGIMYIRNLDVDQPQNDQNEFYSEDSLDIMRNLKVSDLDPALAQQLKEGPLGLFTDDNFSLAKQIAIYYFEGDPALAASLADSVLDDLIPEEFGYSVVVTSEDAELVVHSRGDHTDADHLAVSRTLITGLQQTKPFYGKQAQIHLGNVLFEKTKYFFFGGFIGQGDASINVTLPPQSEVKEVYFEAVLGDDATFFVNGQNCGSITKTSNRKTEVSSGTLDCVSEFAFESNTFEVDFDGADFENQYIGGGYVRLKFETSNLTALTPHKVKHLGAVEGVVNQYDGVYFDGSVLDLNMLLHFDNPAGNIFSVDVGKHRLYEHNISGEFTVNLSKSNFTAVFDLEEDISNETLPIRIASLPPQSDIVFLVERSDQMDSCMNSNKKRTSDDGPIDPIDWANFLGYHDYINLPDSSGQKNACEAEDNCQMGICRFTDNTSYFFDHYLNIAPDRITQDNTDWCTPQTYYEEDFESGSGGWFGEDIEYDQPFEDCDSDWDGDDIEDWWEDTHFLDKTDWSDGSGDADGDGVSNKEEFFWGMDPTGPDQDELPLIPLDTDGDGTPDDPLVLIPDPDGIEDDNDSDGLPDSWEKRFGYRHYDPSDAGRDSSGGDSLTVLEEFRQGTRDQSSDYDGDASQYNPSSSYYDDSDSDPRHYDCIDGNRNVWQRKQFGTDWRYGVNSCAPRRCDVVFNGEVFSATKTLGVAQKDSAISLQSHYSGSSCFSDTNIQIRESGGSWQTLFTCNELRSTNLIKEISTVDPNLIGKTIEMRMNYETHKWRANDWYVDNIMLTKLPVFHTAEQCLAKSQNPQTSDVKRRSDSDDSNHASVFVPYESCVGGNCQCPGDHCYYESRNYRCWQCKPLRMNRTRTFAHDLLDAMMSRRDNNLTMMGYGTDVSSCSPDNDFTQNVSEVQDTLKEYLPDCGGNCISCGLEQAQNTLGQSDSKNKVVVLIGYGNATHYLVDGAPVWDDEEAKTNTRAQILAFARALCEEDRDIDLLTIAMGDDASKADPYNFLRDAAQENANAGCNGQFLGWVGQNNPFDSSSYTQVIDNFKTNTKNIVFGEQEVIERSTNIDAQLYPDSHINYYAPKESLNVSSELIRFTSETQPFERCSDTIDLSGFDQIDEAIFLSYTSNIWNYQERVNTRDIYDLSQHTLAFERAGDPFAVGMPGELVRNTNEFDFEIINATDYEQSGLVYGAGSKQWCHDQNKMVYSAFLPRAISVYSDILGSSEGCVWSVTFSDDTSLDIPVPSDYTGPRGCVYPQGGDYDENNALDTAMNELLSKLDVNLLGGSEGKLDVSLNPEDLSVDASSVEQIPYLWGPAILEVRVWR